MKILGEKRTLEEMLVEKKWLENFEIEKLIEKGKEWGVVLKEKSGNIPKEAIGRDIIQKGYVNEVEVLHGSLRTMPLYIKFKRRRWRDKETGKDYINQYEFHPEGSKVSHEFAAYLKKITRREATALFNDWRSVRYLREEDLSMVPRWIKWIHRYTRTRIPPRT